jgi:HEPN domain-containing protein
MTGKTDLSCYASVQAAQHTLAGSLADLVEYGSQTWITGLRPDYLLGEVAERFGDQTAALVADRIAGGCTWTRVDGAWLFTLDAAEAA